MSILRQCNTFKLDLLTLLFSVQPIELIRAKFLLNAAHSADFHTQIVFFQNWLGLLMKWEIHFTNLLIISSTWKKKRLYTLKLLSFNFPIVLRKIDHLFQFGLGRRGVRLYRITIIMWKPLLKWGSVSQDFTPRPPYLCSMTFAPVVITRPLSC